MRTGVGKTLDSPLQLLIHQILLKMEATSNTKFKTVDEYMSSQPKEMQPILEALRETIKQAASQERVSLILLFQKFVESIFHGFGSLLFSAVKWLRTRRIFLT